MKFWKEHLIFSSILLFFLACNNSPKPTLYASAAPVATIPVPIDSIKIKQGVLYHRLDTYFTNRARFNTFNGNVLVAKGGRVIYKACFGYCDFGQRDSLDPETSFHLASTSKPFTATAILKLVEDGKLKLSDSLRQFFPQMPYKNVTIENLLSHRSGLPNYLYFGEKLWPDKSVYLTNEELVNLLQKNKTIEGTTRAGTHFQYCNTNFALLASIVEIVSGKKFPDYMYEIFFQPLGMRHTFVRNVEAEKQKTKTAKSYNSKWVMQKEDPYDGVYGDKNIYSTIEDLLIWDKAFYEQKNISAASQKLAATPHSFEHKGHRNYGLGWRLMLQPNGTYLQYHNGWWHGNNTVYYRYEPDSFALIILSNKYNRSIYNVQPIFNLITGTKDTVDYGEE